MKGHVQNGDPKVARLSTGAGFLDEDRALSCIHCGLCLGSCPTYLETGNENDSPRGRIYLMRGLEEGRFAMNAGTVKHLDLCLGCLACESACPSGVQYGALLEETREHLDRHYVRGWARRIFERVILEGLLPFPRRLALALMPVRLLCGVGLGRLLPSWLRETMGVTKERRGRPALTTFHPTTAGTCRGRVGLVSGCVMSVLFEGTNAATVALLNHAGYDVVIPRAQGCCGALHLHRGRRAGAREFARRNLEAFGGERLDAIIINAAGCGSTLKEYGRLLADDPAWAEAAKGFSERVQDLSEFLAGDGGFRQSLELVAARVDPVAFHDACHLAHAQQIVEEPRELLRALLGERLVPMPESDVCCGGAGSYFLTQPGMAARLQDRKIGNVLRTGAGTVVTTNPGCLLQIRDGLRRRKNTAVRVVHLADFLWDQVQRKSDADAGGPSYTRPTLKAAWKAGSR
jgi:glycolate oxidase iron-sulfur subunit